MKGVTRRQFLVSTALVPVVGALPNFAHAAAARERTYIVASSIGGPVLTNTNNANFYAAGVDLRNGFMYATEPLFF
jgi:hypothetical protein